MIHFARPGARQAGIALVLLAGISQTRNSKIAEMEIDAGDAVVSGVKTVQVEVKE